MTIPPEQSLPGSPIHRAELVWAHPGLNGLAISVGAYLLTRCGNRGTTHVSAARIRHDLKISDSSVRRAVKQLATIGLFRIKKRQDNRGWDITVAYSPSDTERERHRYVAGIEQAKAGHGEPSNDQTSGRTDRTSEGEVRSEEPEDDKVRSHRPRGPVTQTGRSGHTDRHKQESKNKEKQCSALQPSCDAGTGACEALGAWPNPIPPPASFAQEGAPADSAGGLNGSIERVRSMVREAAQAIGQPLSETDLDQAIARATKDSGPAKTIQAAEEVLAKARNGAVRKADGALVSFARNAKPNGGNGQPSAPTSSAAPAFEEWLSAGTAVVQKAALADLKSGKRETDALTEARGIYDEIYGGRP